MAGYDSAITTYEHHYTVSKLILQGALQGLEMAGESLAAQARHCGGYQ